MRLQLTNKQLEATNKLLKELDEFVNKGYGSVKKILIMKHNMMPNTVIVKYDKVYGMGGDYEFEYPIAAINQAGNIEFIEGKFKDVFERSAFLAECVPFELDDRSKYEIID